MKHIKRIKNKQVLLLGVFFVLFFLSYTVNILHISKPDLFHGFERQPEGLVVGRLARSAQDGLFSYGGLNGINYDSKNTEDNIQYAKDLAAQHDLYITNKSLPDSFKAYKSQSGGQAMLFGVFHKILPLDNVKKLAFYRAMSAMLAALIFVLFGGWVYRNYGFVASFVTLLLILLSPWINMFAHNLWWVLWSFYIPFLTMLLLLEYKSKFPKRISDSKVLIALFVAVFAKCFFTGYEFISSSLAAALCPIVYYAIRERQVVAEFLKFLVKASVTMVAAVVFQMGMLITQIKFLEGTFADGVRHIIFSFVNRSDIKGEVVHISLFELIGKYLQNDAFQLGFLPNDTQFHFWVLILIILVVLVIIHQKIRVNAALAITTLFSILAPLSWLIIFKQHSAVHMHMDFIVWYIPFVLYGYCAIGVAVSLLLRSKEESSSSI